MTAPRQESLVSLRDLTKFYGGGYTIWGGSRRTLHAVNRVSLDIRKGETLGLVGESGSGKSTTGRMIVQLERPTSGGITYEGMDIAGLSPGALKPYRRKMQIIFQDPYSALNPRMKVGDFVAEPLIVHGLARRGAALEDQTADLFRKVGLDPVFMRRYPHAFSGGQRQRINIARAIALEPSFIVADEPITALDVSIQAQIVNLFQDLQDELGVTYLMIAHDLSMVRYLCHRVAVMLAGRVVEMAPTEQLFTNPLHPYTKALLSAIPVPDPEVERNRKTFAFDPQENPSPEDAELREIEPGHYVLRQAAIAPSSPRRNPS